MREFSAKKIWLLGLGFFSISITWALYNAFVPFFLEKYLSSVSAIGFMMTIDNYFAIFLQPIIGRLSDRTHSKRGKRMPFLMIGMPLAALFGALIPFHTSFIVLIVFMVLMNLAMSLYRSPTVALMPDLTPGNKRTQANGIINLMGGIGSILAFAGGSYLFEKHTSLPFLSSSLLTIACLGALLYFIRESRDSSSFVPTENTPKLASLRGEWSLSTLLLLGAIFFWFFSYQGVEALFTLYGKNHIGLSEGEASFSLAFFSLAFVIAALPSGMLGSRLGKRKVIMAGVIGLIAVFSSISFVQDLWTLRLFLLAGGICWALININSYPFIVALGKESSIGTRTGIYYFASSLAAISSPPLLGKLIDLWGYGILFYAAAGGMAIALLFLLFIRDQGRNEADRPQSI